MRFWPERTRGRRSSRRMLLHPWGLAHPSEGAVFRVLVTWFVRVYPWQGPEDAESFSPGIRVGLVLLREPCCSIPAGRWAFGGNHLAILQNLFVAPLRLVVVNISFIILTSGKKNPPGCFHIALGMLPVLASRVTRSPKHRPASPAASPTVCVWPKHIWL